jgi:hypothetical protein
VQYENTASFDPDFGTKTLWNQISTVRTQVHAIQHLQLSISQTPSIAFVADRSSQILATYELLYIEVKDEPAFYVFVGVKSGRYCQVITSAFFVEIASEMSLTKQLAQGKRSSENLARYVF